MVVGSKIAILPTITLSSSASTFKSSGGTDEITVTVTNGNWSASTTDSWIGITTANTGVTITVGETIADRTGTVTITTYMDGMMVTKTITVTQTLTYFIRRTYSNSANYIDLNYTPQSNPRVECKFTVGEHLFADNNYLFGCGMDFNAYSSFKFNCAKSRDNFSYYVGGTYNNYAGAFTTGTTYTVDLSYSGFTVNGVTTTISSYYSYSSSYHFLIGNAYTGTTEYFPEFDLYYMKIYEGDTLKYDLVPDTNSDGYGCLRNTLTNTKYNFTTPSGIILLLE